MRFYPNRVLLRLFKRQIVYFNWTGNKKLAAQLNGKFVSSEAIDEKKGKPGQKIFGDHSFIQRRAKFVKSRKLVNSLIF